MYIYIVVENGEAYPAAYTTYTKAKAAVLAKHQETIDEQRQESLESGFDMVSDVDVKENKESNETLLYIEKGINILIKKIPVLSKQLTRRR
jgi:hypothetical protein